jgi:endoglucanase
MALGQSPTRKTNRCVLRRCASWKRSANSPSPSGFEQPAAQIYRAYTEGFADEVRTDVTGNVMAVLNPDGPVRIMLARHIDEIGF